MNDERFCRFMQNLYICMNFLLSDSMPGKNKKNSFATINEHCFKEIYIEYYPQLLDFALMCILVEENAENIVQDVFVELWKRRAELKTVNISSYLFSMTTNRCMTHLRREADAEQGKKLMQESYEQEFQMQINSLDALDSYFLFNSDQYQIISSAIDMLPPDCREIFMKYIIDGKSYKDIADELKISIYTIKKLLHIALRKLRRQLRYLF